MDGGGPFGGTLVPLFCPGVECFCGVTFGVFLGGSCRGADSCRGFAVPANLSISGGDDFGLDEVLVAIGAGGVPGTCSLDAEPTLCMDSGFLLLSFPLLPRGETACRKGLLPGIAMPPLFLGDVCKCWIGAAATVGTGGRGALAFILPPFFFISVRSKRSSLTPLAETICSLRLLRVFRDESLCLMPKNLIFTMVIGLLGVGHNLLCMSVRIITPPQKKKRSQNLPE
mmetsp:Transcript_3407/g.6968  ORF Transcript_3407/g.6968 Transcript_3407/m.6968 type:complete len:227 (+) Transcript_3407:1290-1970(+)